MNSEWQDEGWQAYRRGERSDSNPHERDTFRYLQWRAGWTNAALMDAATCGADDQS